MNDVAIWGKASWTEVIGAKVLRWDYEHGGGQCGWNGMKKGKSINLLYSFLPPRLPSLASFCALLGEQTDWLSLP